MSYSFFEKDQGQLQNLEFFITAGMGIEQGQSSLPEGTDFSIVVNGDKCSPCIALSSHVEVQHTLQDGVSAMWSSQRIMVLHRSINVGMDLGAHNASQFSPLSNSVLLWLDPFSRLIAAQSPYCPGRCKLKGTWNIRLPP